MIYTLLEQLQSKQHDIQNAWPVVF